MAQSNALALLPDGDGVRSGEDVEVLLLDGTAARITRGAVVRAAKGSSSLGFTPGGF